MDKAQALATYVQSHIRYVAIEIGIGGYQPHSAGDIFKHQYGDCKDKATLLRVMLHEVGIESNLVLAQVYRGIVNPDFASAITFDHVILAIHVPEDAPTQSLFALVNDPKLGKLLFFDPTSSYTPFGYLPPYMQDNYVLVAAAQGGDLVHLPLQSPSTNRLFRTAKLQLDSDGSLHGVVDEQLVGAMADSERETLFERTGRRPYKSHRRFSCHFPRRFSSYAGFHQQTRNRCHYAESALRIHRGALCKISGRPFDFAAARPG